MTRKPLSWKARHYSKDGVTRYCAPACGHDCTLVEHANAHTSAKALADRLNGAGSGWRPVVWENLGWHCKVEHNNRMMLYQFGPRQFWADLIVNGQQFQYTARGPHAAIRGLVGEARSHSKHINAALTGYGFPL